MKSKLIQTCVFTVAAFAALTSNADGVNARAPRDFPAVVTKTREQVKSELAATISQGQKLKIDQSYPGKITEIRSRLTRNEVRAEIELTTSLDDPLYKH